MPVPQEVIPPLFIGLSAGDMFAEFRELEGRCCRAGLLWFLWAVYC